MTDKFNDKMDHEIIRGTKLYGEFRTLHDAIGVIREEYLELEREVFTKVYSVDKIQDEALQVAAMAKKLYLFAEGLR